MSDNLPPSNRTDRDHADVIVVRMDKIGDLVLSFPVDEYPVLRGSVVRWWIGAGLGFVGQATQPSRSYREFPRGFRPTAFVAAWRELRRMRPQTIIVLHAPWWVNLVCFLARVPERMGRLSQWHSFLFLNVGVRQSRSRADRHESDYNFDLVEAGFRALGCRRTGNLRRFKRNTLRLILNLSTGALTKRGLTAGDYRVVHPGMAGSALNWPSENYARLIGILAQEGPVIITGTNGDRKYLAGLESLKAHFNVLWLVGELNGEQLLDILGNALSVVAPSTGVLHLAASLGTIAIGIYSPRRVEHPRRWAPRGPRVRVLMPAVNEAEDFQASVMTNIRPEDVLEELRRSEGER